MVKTLAELYRESASKFGNKPAFFSKDEKKQYTPTNFNEIYEMGLSLGEALVDLGVQAREKIGIIADQGLSTYHLFIIGYQHINV